MKKILVASSVVLSFAALAQAPASTCEAQAADKKAHHCSAAGAQRPAK